MTDYVVFLGATPSLSTELQVLCRRLGVVVVAEAIRKHERGDIPRSIARAISGLIQKVRAAMDYDQPSRLSVWAYSLPNREIADYLWEMVGTYAWIEFIPNNFENKDIKTRQYMETRYSEVTTCLHEVSNQIYNVRRRSPFPLPLRNFSSNVLDVFRRRWYANCTSAQLMLKVAKINSRYQQAPSWSKKGSRIGHQDNGKLMFCPASNEASHGVAHPTGTTDKCFLLGRYRFGAALYPGFHYDVSGERETLACTFYNCEGHPRDVTSEKRRYVNIFPNDHILPEL